MKKTLTFLSVLLFLTASVTMGQTPTKTNTQFPNPGFECWKQHEDASTTSPQENAKWVPFNWHTFDEAWAHMLAGNGTAKDNHHYSKNYNNSSMSQFSGTGTNTSKYIGIVCKYINAVIFTAYANGALSTGRTSVGSSTPTNNANYNYTDVSTTTQSVSDVATTSGYFSWSFIGCPDSMSFYYYTVMNKSSVKPLFKVYLHGNGEFRDRADGSLYSGNIGSTSTKVPLIGCSVDTFLQSSSWKREVHPFKYTRPAANSADNYTFLGQNSSTNATYGYYTSLNRPTYILASFSTDIKAGNSNQSNGDVLYLDELWCIYDKGLASVSIGGTANNTAKNYFNGKEFLTHEPARTYDALGNPSFNNSGSATWNYPTPIACNNIPQVTAMPKSKLITDFQITQATAANGYKATIYVKHNDNSTFYYYIQFTPNTPTVSVSSSASGSVCPGTSVTLTASGASSYAWSDGSTGSTITVQASNRTYTVTGTTSGCTGTASASVSVVNTTAPTITSSNPTSYCGSGSSTFTAQGTGRNPELHWYSNGTEVASGVNASYNATWNTPGTYVITCKQYTDPCLSEPATATVTVYDALVAPVVENQTRCGAGTVTFTVSNPVEGQTYTWKSMDNTVLGTGTSFTTPSLTTNTNYKVQASNPACGAGSDVVVSAIIVNTTLTINSVTSDQTICPNQAIYLSISSTPSSGASLSWDWSPDEGILSGDESSSIRVRPETTTTYTVQVTATNTVNGVTCTATDSRNITVTVNTPVAGTTTVSGPTSICEGGNATLTANTTGNVGGMSYQWSPGTTLNTTTGASVIATPTSNTTYYVTATATNVVNGVSCTATSSSSIIYTVNVTPMPTITAPANKDQTVCAGGQIESIQFICSNNCTVTASNLPAGLNFNSNIGLITGRPTESGTYTITVSNDCGSVTASGTITVNAPAVTLQDLNIAPACEGGTINLAATPSGTPTGTVTYHWSGPNSFTSDEQNPQINNVTSVNAGSYYVTATATNVVNGVSCTATSTKSTIVSVSTPHIELADLEDTTVCAGNYLNLSATKVGSSAGTVTYQWSGPNGFTSSNYYFYRNNMTAADAGVYTVTATATSGVCTVTDIKSANVTVLSPSITLEDLTAQTVCSGTTLSLSATPSGTPSGTVTYSWSGPGNFTSTLQNPQISNVTSANAGRYYVTATATEGSCTATSVKSVINTVNTVSVGTINLSNQEVTICKEQGRATLSVSCSGGSGTRTYAWSPADGLSTTSESTTYASPQTTTTYTVTITATNTVNDVVCTASETREFTVAVNAPAVTLGDITAQSVCAGTTLNLSASPSGTTTGTVTYSWSGPNSFTSTLQNPQITNVTSANAGTYHVTATATNLVNGVSCTATSSKIANVQVKELPYITEPENKNQTVCAGRAISSITFSHGTGTMSVSNLPAGLNFNSTIGLISGTPTQSGTYTVTLTNDCGTVTASGTITVNAPSVTLENIANQTVCAGSALNLSATPTSTPVGTVTYAWTGPNGFTSNEQNIHIDNVTTNHAGNYSVTATATVGSCTVTSTKSSSITINNPSVTLQDIASQTLCAGENLHLTAATTGSTVGTVSYAWSGPAGFTESGKDIYRNYMTSAYAGTYTVTATATRNVYDVICTATDTKSVQVTVNAPVAGTLNVIGNTTICAGNSTTLTASVTGNTGTMSYAWSPATGLDATSGAQVTANPTATTTYTVTATATVGTCTTSTTKQVTVTVNQIPTVAITGNTTFCQGNTETLSATSGYAQYVWSNGGRNASIDVTTSGSYSVTVTNNSGCQNNASVTVTVLPVPSTPTATSVNNTSCASPNGSITVTAPTGSNYTYSIGGAFQSATTFSNLSAGNYTLTVKNSSGCTSTTEVEVGATGNSVNATATANTPCAGDMLQLTGASTTTGVAYAWTGPNSFTSTQQNPQISNATSANAGTYTLTVTETATNCTKIATVNVTVNALPTVTVSGATTICAGTSANLTAQGANDYVWSNGQEGAEVSIAEAGSVTVTGTDANGCSNTANVTITINTPYVALNAMTDVVACEGDNVTLSASVAGANGPMTFVWTGPNGYRISNQIIHLNGITTAQSGQYTVVVTTTRTVNDLTCTATDSKSVNVTVNALPTITISGETTICAGTSANLTAQGANNYVWSNGQEGAEVSIAEAGSVTVTGTDVNNCTSTASVTITVNEPSVALNAMTDVDVCEGGNVTLNAVLNGTATGDVTYAWTGPNSYTSAQQNPQLNGVTTAQSGEYTVVATATNVVNGVSCAATDSKTVNVTVNALPAAPVLTIVNNTSCATPNGSITVTSPTGANYQYSINGGDYQTSTIFENLDAGNFTVSVKDVNTGCMNENSVRVTTQGSTLEVEIAVNEVCAGGTAAFQSTLTNATGDVTYAWTGPAGFTSAAENPTINNVQSRNAGTYTLQVTETATSCRVSATTTLVVNEPTTGDTSAVACVSFDWYEHTGLTTSGDYTHVFVGGNANGCDSTVTLHLTINKPTVGDTTAVACVSYDWYEHTGLTTSGDYTHVFEGGNANGCDSTVTLHLTINTPTTGDTTAVACDSFDWYEHTGLTTSGDYTHVFVGGNANGCDSTVTLHLTINKTPVVTVSGELSIINGNSTTLTASGADTYKWSTEATTASITVSPTVNTEYSVVGTTNGCTSAPVSVTVIVNECVPGRGDTTVVACEEFTWYGTTYTESTETAMHVFEGVMADGCDSIVTLHLTINHAVASSMTATECGSFTWNGETYTESGEYTHAYAAANGCDSVVTLNLTINQPVTSSSTITACDSYTWNSETYTESGDYTQTFTAANGCDSVVTLHLTINTTPVVTVSGELSIINGNSTTLTASGADTYEWNTEATTASITVAPTENTEYSVVGTTNGCTSAPVSVTVIVNDCVPGSGDTTAVACEEFTWYGTTYTESTETAMHVFEGVMADGCDSIVTLHLTINHAVSSSMTATECGSFTWNGETYTESGEYTHAYAAANGCDSVVTLNLTINQPVTYRMSATACESYTWNGQTYNESGEYTQTFTAANGCDSVVTLDLTVQHAVAETISATACESYTWNTETYTESGEYTQTFTAATGCDSVVTLNLTINQPVNQQIEAVACGSYTWNEETYEESGEYMQTFTAANGCDSVVTLNLTINQPTEGDTAAVACETFTWYEHAKINESGDYIHIFEGGNANGCDSVVTLHLTINHMVTNSIFVTACESYIWNEQTYTESGEYTQTFTAANGCDSVVTLELTIQPALEETITVTACQSYTWNTQTYTESGEYTQTFTAATGCDSVVTLILTINNEIDEQIEAVACGSYTWNEEIYEMSGVYTQTFTAANGCDSVVTLYLTINLPTEGDTTATACETFDWYEHTGITASGNYTHIFENGNADGCDSVVTLHLTINQPVTNAISATACQSYTWNEQTYNASGEYTQTFTAANGCDSVVTLNLIINLPTEGDTTAVECMTFDWYEHVGLTTSGNYTHVFENANAAGCDSIVTLHLTINTEIHNNLTEHGCDSYEWDGDVYYTSGVYTKSYPLPNGCDSIVTIDLTITPSYHIEIKDTICEGALYAHYNFMETEAGDYTQNLQTANGCDSIVILHLATKECSSDCGTDVQDIDRNVYGTKAVNHLCWMTSNLRTTRYSDATPIPFAVVYSYPYDPNDTTNLETYGRLYDWASASRNAAPTRSPHVQGACPFGWRLPSQEEFEEWASAYTMDQLRSTSNWLIENGNNASGLNMQPAGFYNSNTQRCEELHGKAYFYTSDYYGSTQDVVHMVAQCGCWELLFTRDKNLNDAYSVRCVKDIE
ncbi:MAG: putative Ig domain-containing protein [Bacteroidales bacterium]|nr:putative Ig domain-containing protein [Bacteroidales bacterium]